MNTTIVCSNEFERLVAESVYEELADLLGQNVRGTVYRYLERAHGISKDRMPSRLSEFHLALDEVFGVPASHVIEKRILEALSLRLGLELTDNPDCTLFEYAVLAKRWAEQKKYAGRRCKEPETD